MKCIIVAVIVALAVAAIAESKFIVTYVLPVAYSLPKPGNAGPQYVKKKASYPAANRGAVHEAPLPGHAVNQQSLNLAPAPGTL